MGEDKRPPEASTNGWGGLGGDGEWSQWRRWATGVVFAPKLNIDRGRARKMPVSHEEISFLSGRTEDGKSQRVRRAVSRVRHNACIMIPSCHVLQS